MEYFFILVKPGKQKKAKKMETLIADPVKKCNRL